METMMTVAANSEEGLVRQLSVTGIWLLIVNGMIGAGIFGLPAALAGLAGGASTWVFLLCALMIAPIMLCLGQMSSYFRNTGGPILYASEAFGPMAGFQVGWLYYISRVLSFAANLNLMVVSAGYFLPDLMQPSMRIASVFVVSALMTVINVLGARGAVRMLGLLTLLKILPLIALIAAGLLTLDIGSYLPRLDQTVAINDLGAAVFLVIYAYVGFEGALVNAGEARRPRRDTPRALLAALITCALLYTAIQAISLATLPELGASKRPLVDVAAVQLGDAGALIMLVAIIASVGGNLLGAMFSTPRLTYRMALDGYLPRILASVHPRFQTPAASIILYGAASFAFAATGGFVWLAGLSLLSRLILYLVCVSALPRLRRRYGDMPESVRPPGGLTWMILALLACALLLWQVTLQSLLVTSCCVVLGLLMFLWARRANGRSAAGSVRRVSGARSSQADRRE
jgi:amino acid transporter